MPFDPAVSANDLSLEEAQHALEERVGRLERAVAALQAQQSHAAEVWPTGTLPQVKVGPALPEDHPARPSQEPGEARADPSPHVRPPWLLFDLVSDLKAMARMFVDVRYRVSWSTWLALIVLIPLILLSGWWFPLAYLPILGDYLDKVLDFVLAFVLYKALSREARRYRQAVGP